MTGGTYKPELRRWLFGAGAYAPELSGWRSGELKMEEKEELKWYTGFLDLVMFFMIVVIGFFSSFKHVYNLIYGEGRKEVTREMNKRKANNSD